MSIENRIEYLAASHVSNYIDGRDPENHHAFQMSSFQPMDVTTFSQVYNQILRVGKTEMTITLKL